MSTLDRTPIHAGYLSSRIIYLAVQAVSDLVDWVETRRTTRLLSQLSDRELQDVGLIRADIDRVARSW